MPSKQEEVKTIYRNTCAECKREFETYIQVEQLCMRCEMAKPISLSRWTCARCGQPLKRTNFYCAGCKP